MMVTNPVSRSSDMPDDEIATLEWEDTDFWGFHWVSQASHPTLVLSLVRAPLSNCKLICEWACRVVVNLDYDQLVGPLMCTDIRFESLSDERWRVLVDLPPSGFIKFECNRLRLESV